MGDISSLNRRLLWGGLAIFLFALIGWLVVSSQIRNQHFEAILNEICSVGEFRKAPVVNHSNSMLCYARNEEKGLGIYQMDLKTLSSLRVNQINNVDSGVDY